MVPVFPDKDKVVPVPAHNVELAAETEPATEVGLTVIEVVLLEVQPVVAVAVAVYVVVVVGLAYTVDAAVPV